MKIQVMLIATAVMCWSCTVNFLEYNKDPYGVSDEVLASGGIAEKLANDCAVLSTVVIPLQENLYQHAISLGCESLSGYMGQTNFGDFGQFNFNTGFIEYPFTDEQSLPRVISQYNSLSLDTNADRENVFYAWGTILKVAIMHRISDMYGPVPYDFTGTDAQKPYQTQEEVYRMMIEDLTWASETLSSVALSTVERNAWALQDDVYSADIDKWVKFANSLKLRLAVRVSGQLPDEAAKWAEEAVSGGVIESNAENAQKPTADNPFYKMSVNWGDTRCGADIIAYMNAYQDPRREAYFKTTSRGGDEMWFGLRSGVNLPSKETLAADGMYSVPVVEMDDPVVWMTAAEVAFLRAEGALKGWNMGGDAKTFYEQGIRLSFDEWGVTGADAYIADATSVPGNHTDPEVQQNNCNNKSKVTIAWDESADPEKKLEKIITQKWIAGFPSSLEAWSDFRRTGYPYLFAPRDNQSQPRIDGERQQRRLRFSQSEYERNTANVEAAAAMLDGGDEDGTELWWALKNGEKKYN